MNPNPPSPPARSDPARAPSRPAVALPTGGGRILAVDDDESVRLIYALILADAGYRVEVAADGEEAWEALTVRPYDLLLTDNDMPRLTGLELTRRLRVMGSALPVIVATGSPSEFESQVPSELRLTAILAKPFCFSELVTVVKRALPPSPRRGRSDPRQNRLRGLKESKDTADPGSGDTPLRRFLDGFNRTETMKNRIPPVPAPDPRPVAPLVLHKRLHAGRRRVLIADDDAVVRGSLAAVLESEGFQVDEAQDGLETVTRAAAHAPDLVLLDLNMPKLDGWKAFSRLDDVRPLVPVIVITARPHQYREAVRLGVDAFMEKPLDIPILVRAVKQLTSEDENRHTQRITNRDFVTRLLTTARSG